MPATATAYANRDAAYDSFPVSIWSDAAADEQNIAWAREMYAILRPFGMSGVYVNNLCDEGHERVQLPAILADADSELRINFAHHSEMISRSGMILALGRVLLSKGRTRRSERGLWHLRIVIEHLPRRSLIEVMIESCGGTPPRHRRQPPISRGNLGNASSINPLRHSEAGLEFAVGPACRRFRPVVCDGTVLEPSAIFSKYQGPKGRKGKICTSTTTSSGSLWVLIIAKGKPGVDPNQCCSINREH